MRQELTGMNLFLENADAYKATDRLARPLRAVVR